MRNLKPLVVGALLLSVVGVAQAADEMNIFRGGSLFASPTGDLSDSGGTVEAESTVGLQASYERKLSSMIGVNFMMGYTNYDVAVKGSGIDEKFAEQSAMPLGVSMLFHPIKSSKVDWYIGPGVSYIMYDDMEIDSDFTAFAGTDTVDVDNDTAVGAQTGVDIKLGTGNWNLNFDLQYMKTAAEDLDIDPITVGAGVALHF